MRYPATSFQTRAKQTMESKGYGKAVALIRESWSCDSALTIRNRHPTGTPLDFAGNV